MGRVIKCYPDQQGVVHKVDLKTASKELVHRRANRLIPLLPDADEETDIPAPRRSPRNHATAPVGNNRVLLTRVVQCWMTLVLFAASTNSALITPLAPGVHVQTLGNVFMKAYDIEFGVITSINVTEDAGNTMVPVNEMNIFCEAIEEDTFEELKRSCMGVRNSLQAEAEAVNQMIGQNSLKQRKRRFTPVVRPIGKLVSKFAPHLLIAGTVLYQTGENTFMERNIEILKQKLTKLTQISLKLQTLEFAAIDSELAKIYNQEKKLQIDDAINGYAIAARILFSDIRSRYNMLKDACPIKELKTFLAQSHNLDENVQIPPIARPCEIFRHGQRSAKNDFMEITFKIELATKEVFTEFGIISVPNDKYTAFNFGNDFVTIVAVTQDFASYFFPLKEIQLFQNVFAVGQLIKTTTCVKETLRSPNSSHKCENSTWERQDDKIFSLGEGSAVIWSTEQKITVRCDGKTTIVEDKATLVDFKGCILLNGNRYISSALHGEEKGKEVTQRKFISPPDIPINKRKINPEIKKLQLEIEAELQSSDEWLTKIGFWKHLALGSGPLIMIGLVGLIVVSRHMQLKNRTKRTTSLEPKT